MLFMCQALYEAVLSNINLYNDGNVYYLQCLNVANETEKLNF